MCLTRKKKQILCPYCTETCSTNWNLRIHIQRKHSGKAKPATPGSYATSTQFSSSDVSSNMPITTTNDRHYYHPDNNNGSYHQTSPSYGHFSELDSKKLKESSSFKKRDAGHELLETIRQALEIINITKQQQRRPTFWQPPSTGEGGISWPSSGFITPSPPNLLNSYNNSTTRNMWGTNKNIVGFRGYICYNCLSYWAQSNEGDMKSLIQVKPNHKCYPNKVAHALNVLDIQSKKNELYSEFIDFLVMLSRYLTVGASFSQRNMYLKAQELVPTSYSSDYTAGIHDSNVQSAATNNSNKGQLLSTQEEQSTDLTNIIENNWAYRKSNKKNNLRNQL